MFPSLISHVRSCASQCKYGRRRMNSTCANTETVSETYGVIVTERASWYGLAAFMQSGFLSKAVLQTSLSLGVKDIQAKDGGDRNRHNYGYQ